MQTKAKHSIYTLTMIAVMTAVTCILAPLSISIGPIPISFTNLAIYFALYLLGWKKGTVSYLVYLLIGIVGLPVFSGFVGGIGKIRGVVIGVLMLRLIFVGLNMVGVNQDLFYVIKGGIILFACALDMRKYLVKK